MQITTIIPTLCLAVRGDSLARAIASVHRASEGVIKVLVVVNGQRFDKNLLETLLARRDVEVLQIADASLTKAHLAGRRAVSTEYFSFLDDDDEYLAGALDVRLEALQANPLADLVITNGYSFAAGKDRVTYSRTSYVESSPVRELFQENWLHNCNHLFRAASVKEEYFENAHAYMEWTWLAFRLALSRKRVVAIDVPTFRYFDTPGSLSKSPNYLRSRVALYRRMLAMQPGKDAEQMIRRRLSSAWHDVSTFELGERHRLKAACAHMHSLASHWSGLKFLLYSRRLLW